MRDWIHWLWQQWEWEGDLSPELTREIVRAEEALLEAFTPEQRELYEVLEEVRARRDLREQSPSSAPVSSWAEGWRRRFWEGRIIRVCLKETGEHHDSRLHPHKCKSAEYSAPIC